MSYNDSLLAFPENPRLGYIYGQSLSLNCSRLQSLQDVFKNFSWAQLFYFIGAVLKNLKLLYNRCQRENNHWPNWRLLLVVCKSELVWEVSTSCKWYGIDSVIQSHLPSDCDLSVTFYYGFCAPKLFFPFFNTTERI